MAKWRGPKISRRALDTISFVFRIEQEKAGTLSERDRQALLVAMRRCRMTCYPRAPQEADEMVRACGDTVCPKCSQAYRNHPLDWRAIGYDGRPFLHVLCSGQRVKL